MPTLPEATSARPKTSPWAWPMPAVSAVVVAWMLISYARFVPITSLDISFFAASLSPFVLAATVLLLSRPRIGNVMTIIGGVLPLFWIYKTESRAFMNTWVLLNASEAREETVCLRYAQLRIACAALLLFALVSALIRLLPSRWHVRKLAVNRHTWPAFVVTFLVIAWWFAAFALPYRQPVIVDAKAAELNVLHVEKDGLDFHETRISVYRDGRFLMTHNDRRLFRYKFEEVWHEGALTESQALQLKTLLVLPDLQRTQDRSPKALRAAHGEGWYTPAARAFVNREGANRGRKAAVAQNGRNEARVGNGLSCGNPVLEHHREGLRVERAAVVGRGPVRKDVDDSQVKDGCWREARAPNGRCRVRSGKAAPEGGRFRPGSTSALRLCGFRAKIHLQRKEGDRLQRHRLRSSEACE
jgi:hypothetical protein